MSPLAYLKIGGMIALLGLAGLFSLHYKHLRAENERLQVQVKAQQEVIAFHERAIEIDEKTRELNHEIRDAVRSGDIKRLRDLIERLRQHKRNSEN